MKEKKTRIMIVDDHPVVRKGLTGLINSELDLIVCGETASARETLEAVLTLEPDVIVVEIALKKDDGIELIKSIKTRHPKLPVLVLSVHDESLYAERALQVGAWGYVTKEEETKAVLEAIRRVQSGELYVSDKVASKLLRKLVNGRLELVKAPIRRLTKRELQVFRLISQGCGTRQIAGKLNVSVKTVESHRGNIKQKLKLNDSSEMLRYAIQWVRSQN
jgi:DNA-binding NarL/FixJ family response regulator